MKPLRIDFLRRRPRASLLGWALMFAGGAGLSVAAVDHQQARSELRSLQDRVARQDRGLKIRPLRVSAPASADGGQAQARASAAMGRPWGVWLRDLERLSDPKVALLGVDMQGAAGAVRITAEAPDMAQAVAYVERLRRSSLARSVVLGTHEVRLDGEVEVIRFSLDMELGARS